MKKTTKRKLRRFRAYALRVGTTVTLLTSIIYCFNDFINETDLNAMYCQQYNVGYSYHGLIGLAGFLMTITLSMVLIAFISKLIELDGKKSILDRVLDSVCINENDDDLE